MAANIIGKLRWPTKVHTCVSQELYQHSASNCQTTHSIENATNITPQNNVTEIRETTYDAKSTLISATKLKKIINNMLQKQNDNKKH